MNDERTNRWANKQMNHEWTIKRMIECMRDACAGTWRWDGVHVWHGGPLVSWHPPCQRIPTWRVHWTLWGMPLINPPQVNILAQHAVSVDNSAVCWCNRCRDDAVSASSIWLFVEGLVQPCLFSMQLMVTHLILFGVLLACRHKPSEHMTHLNKEI